MKTLLLLRHAKSSWDEPGLDDHDRPLNARGERDAPRMGLLIRSEGLIPDLVLSSDALRARLTAEAVAAAAEYQGTILLDGRLYHANPVAIVSVIRDVMDSQPATVMIVGHNPGLEELLARLTGETEEMPTATLARIALPIDRWSDLETATRGALVGMWRPRDL
jgi:phosphohistidine phosphatase